jgi:CRP-like cAMP-binding protein
VKIPKAALEQHTAVLGKTGSGKTSTAKLLVEQVTAEDARVCILDPIKSDWWGLTSSADGKKPGLPFQILGGPHGHVPLHSSAGKAVGELVARGDLRHSIIDMADFEPGGQAKFFTEFAPALLRAMRGVVYLVIEEAHLFAPKEKSGLGSENLSIHWAKTIATAGRSKGIRLVLVTQRTQSLHNALLGSCETLIAHRFTAPADQEPILKWLKANVDAEIYTQVASSLSSLKTGEGWFCSGEAKIFERRQFPRIHTYDNSATPTDDSHREQVATAPVDRAALVAILGKAVEEATANDPKVLRARIDELQAELANLGNSAGSAEPDEAALELARLHGYRDAITALQKSVADRFAVLTQALGDAVTGVGNDMLELLEGDSTGVPSAVRIVRIAPPRTAAGTEGPPANATVHKLVPIRAQSGTDQNLPRGEQQVLTAIAQHREGVTREQITVLTGYKRSTRDAYVQRLRERGLVDVGGDRIVATGNGLAALGPDFKPLPKGAALRKYWTERLPAGERRVFEVVANLWPQNVDRDKISAATDFKRSTRDAYLQRLATRQLITADRGTVRASDALFR